MDYPEPANLWRSDDGECWLFEVRRKNTKGGEPTIRDAWMPADGQDDVGADDVLVTHG